MGGPPAEDQEVAQRGGGPAGDVATGGREEEEDESRPGAADSGSRQCSALDGLGLAEGPRGRAKGRWGSSEAVGLHVRRMEDVGQGSVCV